MRSISDLFSDDFDEIVTELICGSLSEKVENVWNIGGAEIYKIGLEKGFVNQILITKIRQELVSFAFCYNSRV